MLVAEEEETGAEKEKSWHGKEGNVEKNKMTMNRIYLYYIREPGASTKPGLVLLRDIELSMEIV